MTSIATLLILASSGVQYVGEYPSMDSCLTAARTTVGVDNTHWFGNLSYRFLCVPGADWAEELQ